MWCYLPDSVFNQAAVTKIRGEFANVLLLDLYGQIVADRIAIVICYVRALRYGLAKDMYHCS